MLERATQLVRTLQRPSVAAAVLGRSGGYAILIFQCCGIASLFLFYLLVSVPRCILLYTCRKTLRMLPKLMELCKIMGRRESVGSQLRHCDPTSSLALLRFSAQDSPSK